MSQFSVSFTNQKIDDNSLSFTIKGDFEHGLDKTIINSIRRVLLTDIPTFGFRTEDEMPKDIIISLNNTALHNEYIAHRISLIPLYMNPETYQKHYLFQLNVKHNSNDLYKFITTRDFEVFPLRSELEDRILNLEEDYDHDDPDYKLEKHKIDEILQNISPDNYDLMKPLSEKQKDDIFKPSSFRGVKNDTLITELKNTNDITKPQEIILYGSPSISTGKEHARWQSVSCATYSFTKDEDMFKRVLEDKLQFNNIDPSNQKEYSRDLYLSESERYYLRDQNNEPYVYDCIITSVHYYDSKELFCKACEILLQKLNDLRESFKQTLMGLDSSIDIEKVSEFVYHFIIHDQNDTLGNMLQSYISKKITDKDCINVCGYKKIHPLEEKIKMIISLQPKHKIMKKNEQQKISDIISYIHQSIDQLVAMYEIIMNTANKQL